MKPEKKTFGKKSTDSQKKPYTPPRLTVHGGVEEITKVLRLAGAKSEDGSGIPSDRNLKENFAPVNGEDILERLATIPVETWNYKSDHPSVRHMGPMAQDFARAFGLGEDDRHIHNIDSAGVALASIKALYGMMLDKERDISKLKRELEEISLMNPKEQSFNEESTNSKKKPYTPPRIIVHGDAQLITQAVSGPANDGLSGSQPPSSDRNAKENFAPVDGRDVLTRLASIPVETWNYKSDHPSVRHMGPMAQDFAGAFGLGEDDKRIHTIDSAGVALAAIQALYEMMLEKEREIEALRRQVEELRAELTEPKSELAPL